MGLDFYFLLGIYVVEVMCGLFFSFYRMAHYAHAKDTQFGKSCFARFIIVVGIFMWIIPILWIPMDVLLSQRSDLAREVNSWVINIIQVYQLAYLWAIIPIFFAFYETEVSEAFSTRCCQAIRLQMPLFLFLVMANVPTFFFLNEVELDVKDCSFTGNTPNTVIDGEEYYVGESSFPMYVYIVTVWIGLLMTSICGGIGLIFLPYNLFNDFIFRPKPIKKADFGKR